MMLTRYWHYVETDVSEGEESETAAYIHSPISVAANGESWNFRNAPMLMLTCTNLLGLGIAINWSTALGVPEPSATLTPLTLQLDSDPPRQEEWRLAMENHYTYYPSNTSSWLKELTRGRELRVEASGPNGRQFDAGFDLRGLKHIAPLVQEDCGGT